MNGTRLLIDIVDALALGLPSAVIAPQLNRKYEIEYRQLVNLISQVTKEYNQLINEIGDLELTKDRIIADSAGYSPLGITYKRMMSNLNNGEIERKKSEMAKKETQLADLNRKADIASSKVGRTLGSTIDQDGIDNVHTY